MTLKKSREKQLAIRDPLKPSCGENFVDTFSSLDDDNKELNYQSDDILIDLDKSVSGVKKIIATLKRSSRFISYYESAGLVYHLGDLSLVIANDLKEKSPEQAFDLMLDFLDLHKKTIERVDDSDGFVAMAFRQSCKDLGSIAKSIKNLNTEKIIEVIFKRFVNDGYYIYDDLILSFKGVLKDQDFDLLQEKLENYANGENDSRIKLGLQSIADCKEDVDLYIRASLFKDSIDDYDYLEIAKRLIEHSRPKEALQWLDNMPIYSNHHCQEDRRNLKIQALELEGYGDQAQKERLSFFAENFSSKLYKEILATAEPEFQESFKSDAIKMSFQFPEVYIAMDFLVKIKEVDALANFVHARYDELDGWQDYKLRAAANLLKSPQPIAATLLYRKIIQAVLDKTTPGIYGYAPKALAMCTILAAKITDWGDLQSHDEYFQDIELQHKRKTRFWSDYKSALQEQAEKEAKMKSRA